MTIKRFLTLAFLTMFGFPLAGCGLLVPLAVVAVESAPEIIEEIEAPRPPVAPSVPAVRLPEVRHIDDMPLIEPNDLAP